MVRENPIRLCAAPARFFADDWARLASLKGGEAAALEALDNPDPAIIVAYRRRNLEMNFGTPEALAEAKADEEVDALVNRLHDGLRTLGSEGRIIGSGLFPGTGRRQDVPAELWATAKPAFGTGSVASTGFVYHYVTIELASASGNSERTASEMSAWLDNRRAERGEEAKKILHDAARKKFGAVFRARIFDKAYAASYKRARGRPEK